MMQKPRLVNGSRRNVRRPSRRERITSRPGGPTNAWVIVALPSRRSGLALPVPDTSELRAPLSAWQPRRSSHFSVCVPSEFALQCVRSVGVRTSVCCSVGVHTSVCRSASPLAPCSEFRAAAAGLAPVEPTFPPVLRLGTPPLAEPASPPATGKKHTSPATGAKRPGYLR